MRIIRFIREDGYTSYGYNYQAGYAQLIEGGVFTDYTLTGKTAKVVKLLAPIPPRVILCIGLNYRQHAEETGAKVPNYPILFTKNLNSVCAPGDAIMLPKVCQNPPEVDFEAELAVVIGRPVKNATHQEALQSILGYTIANDVSARRWQTERGGGQWVRGKSFDTFCPLGPELVTADELEDPQNLEVTCDLNGERMQTGNTSDMIFSVTDLIQELSAGTTLTAGSVILTGTPSGVGFTRNPPVYLKNGDTVKISISQIGTLENPVHSES